MKKSAYALLELLIVLFVIATVAAFVLPMLPQFRMESAPPVIVMQGAIVATSSGEPLVEEDGNILKEEVTLLVGEQLILAGGWEPLGSGVDKSGVCFFAHNELKLLVGMTELRKGGYWKVIIQKRYDS